MTVHWRVAKPPSTVIHAGWLVRRRAGRVFLPNSDMGQVPPPGKRAAETLVADTKNLNELRSKRCFQHASVRATAAVPGFAMAG
jgi:hypothetical protein